MGISFLAGDATIGSSNRLLRIPVLLSLAAVLTACSAGVDPTSEPGRVYLELATRSIRSEPPPAGFYVEGELQEGRLVPAGEIRGDGEFGHEGHPGWLELADLTFHGDETGRAPFPPYVRGLLGDDGVFRPLSRKIQY